MRFIVLLLSISFTLNALTIEEKVGQLMMVHFMGDCLNGDAKRLMDEAHVGGFILYNWANKLESHEQIAQLTSELQSYSKTPLFIALDQEGGPVRRIKEPYIISNKEVGSTNDPRNAYSQATAIGQILKKCGVNFNLAPVADISEAKGINPERCYSSDPYIVAAFIQEALKSYKDQELIATLKHFPGHGSVAVDSHVGLPYQHKSLEELEKSDLIPFQGADVIMTSHIVVTALDPLVPATYSPLVIEGFLRGKRQFEGVIITDSVVMAGSLGTFPDLKSSCKAALLAGHDILLFGGQDLQKMGRNELTVEELLTAYNEIVRAVKAGEISESRIDESVSRVQKLKKKYRLC